MNLEEYKAWLTVEPVRISADRMVALDHAGAIVPRPGFDRHGFFGQVAGYGHQITYESLHTTKSGIILLPREQAAVLWQALHAGENQAAYTDSPDVFAGLEAQVYRVQQRAVGIGAKQ